MSASCRTHGAVYTINVSPGSVEVRVRLPSIARIRDRRLMRQRLHDATEHALSSVFPGQQENGYAR